MCIVAIAWQVIDGLPLVLMSNRDEFYQREAMPLNIWPDANIIAGQDASSGGTWLGITAQGRWAIITNYREITDHAEYAVSRGQLVLDFLNSEQSPWRFALDLQQRQTQYAGFNLICGDGTQAVYCSNRGAAPQLLANGVYVLSNGLLSDSWQKCEHLRKRFAQELLPPLQNPSIRENLATLLPVVWDVLQDRRQLTHSELPHTGVALEMEQLLSSTFIQSPIYGTRCSNFLTHNGFLWQWWEKTQQGAQQDHVVFIDTNIIDSKK